MTVKIKTLHIIKSLGRGGAEVLLPETLKLHDQSKFEFHYLYFLPWKNQMVDAIRQAGGKVTCLEASNNFQIILHAKRIAQYIQEHDIQLVHAHLPWAGFAGRLVHRFTRVPLIYTEHNKQERYHFLTRWINKITFNWQSLVIAVSGDVTESIDKNIRSTTPVRQVRNGVDIDFFQRSEKEGKLFREKLNISPTSVVVGIVAVFRPQKRLMEWLDVFAEASTDNPNLVGIMVGDGTLKKELEDHITTLNLKGKIIMTGLQTEVRSWYSAMDIFMMTSEFEGLPVALLEAMSMECAVVTTDAGGIKEVMVQEVNGLVEPVDQWRKLVKHLDRLAKEPSQRHQLAVAARKQVVQSFSMERMVKELEKLYLQTLKVRI